jgi:hypothetical protein
MSKQSVRAAAARQRSHVKSFADSDRKNILSASVATRTTDGNLCDATTVRSGIIWSVSGSELGHKKSTVTSWVTLMNGSLTFAPGEEERQLCRRNDPLFEELQGSRAITE